MEKQSTENYIERTIVRVCSICLRNFYFLSHILALNFILFTEHDLNVECLFHMCSIIAAPHITVAVTSPYQVTNMPSAAHAEHRCDDWDDLLYVVR